MRDLIYFIHHSKEYSETLNFIILIGKYPTSFFSWMNIPIDLILYYNFIILTEKYTISSLPSLDKIHIDTQSTPRQEVSINFLVENQHKWYQYRQKKKQLKFIEKRPLFWSIFGFKQWEVKQRDFEWVWTGYRAHVGVVGPHTKTWIFSPAAWGPHMRTTNTRKKNKKSFLFTSVFP